MLWGQGGDRVSAVEDGEVLGAVGRCVMLRTVHLTVTTFTLCFFYHNEKCSVSLTGMQ